MPTNRPLTVLKPSEGGEVEKVPHQEQVEQPRPKHWMPTDRALITARESVTLTDIPLHLAHYRIRCQERNTNPTSGEWLRWLISDEKQAQEKERKEAREERRTNKWHSVAD